MTFDDGGGTTWVTDGGRPAPAGTVDARRSRRRDPAAGQRGVSVFIALLGVVIVAGFGVAAWRLTRRGALAREDVVVPALSRRRA
ncbi:hypothetical protein NKG94_29795 [Micromonospora sp. M12]